MEVRLWKLDLISLTPGLERISKRSEVRLGMNRQVRARQETNPGVSSLCAQLILSPQGPSGRAIVGLNVRFVLFDEAEPDSKIMPSVKQRYKLNYDLVYSSILSV